jgi:hypothetical protein
MTVSWREPILRARFVPNRAYAQHHGINEVQLEGKRSGEKLDDYKLPRQRLSGVPSMFGSLEVQILYTT